MTKSNRSKVNTPVIFIYGFPATGKLTIAEEIAKITGYRVFHNHMIIDLMDQLFESGNIDKQKIREWLHLKLIEKLTKTGHGFIYTHAYSSSYTSKTGLKDSIFLKKVEKTVKNASGKFYPIFITCSDKKILRRTKNQSRKKHGKLRDIKIMKELLLKEDHTTSAPVLNNIQIDTTKTSPQQVAKLIVNKINQK